MTSHALVVLSLVVFMFAAAQGTAWSRTSVIQVENGTHFTHNDDGVSFRAPSGQMSFVRNPEGKITEKRDQGWIASVWYFNSVDYYSATWVVPATPATTSGQILFFFNSFENSNYNDILQPVLQFNNGVAGWTLASWYGVNGQYYESTPISVAVGATINGVIRLSGGTWFVDGYINGVLRTSISASFSSVGAQANAQFALEVYTVTQCSQYPPSNALNVNNIVIRNGGTQLSPSWQSSVNGNSCSAGASGTSSTARITWNSGSSSSSGGQSTSGCGSGLLYCPGNGQCYSSSAYVCSGTYPYLCPTSASHFCNGGCSAATC